MSELERYLDKIESPEYQSEFEKRVAENVASTAPALEDIENCVHQNDVKQEINFDLLKLNAGPVFTIKDRITELKSKILNVSENTMLGESVDITFTGREAVLLSMCLDLVLNMK